MPTAAPANAIVAQPAPINFAPSNMLNFDVGLFFKTMTFDWLTVLTKKIY